MEDRVLVKVLLLLSFSLRSSPDTHHLQFLSALTSGKDFPEFTAVGLLDGEQVSYYDSNNRRMIPKTEWIQKINITDPGYWDSESEKLEGEQHTFKFYLSIITKNTAQTKGNHTLQRMYGCELDDDGTTRGHYQFGYDGEDFFSLDLNTGTWTAYKPQALIFIKEWDPSGDEAKKQKSYLEKECIDWIKNLVYCSKATPKRKDPPKSSVFQKHSPSPEVVCHATGFFPKELMISWRKDGEDVNEDVELRETLPNQDGSFQKRIILKVPAEDLQKHKYTCVIQHSSLKEEMVLDENINNSDKSEYSGSGGGSGGGSDGGSGGGIIAGVVVTVVLALLVSAGIMVWRWRRRRAGVRRQKPDVL